MGNYLYENLHMVPGVRIYGPAPSQTVDRAALCSFNVEGLHPTDIATFLDQQVFNQNLHFILSSKYPIKWKEKKNNLTKHICTWSIFDVHWTRTHVNGTIIIIFCCKFHHYPQSNHSPSIVTGRDMKNFYGYFWWLG